MKIPNCKFCRQPMSIGKALVNPIVSFDDFGNDVGQTGTTCSPDLTRADLVDVWKCGECGYSKERKSETAPDKETL